MGNRASAAYCDQACMCANFCVRLALATMGILAAYTRESGMNIGIGVWLVALALLAGHGIRTFLVPKPLQGSSLHAAQEKSLKSRWPACQFTENVCVVEVRRMCFTESCEILLTWGMAVP